jgi:HEAT repeat protein
MGLFGDLLAPVIDPEKDTTGTQISLVATRALASIGKPAVEPLVKAVQDTSRNSTVRGCAATTLGKIGDARAIQSLLDALDDEEQPVRLFASHALGEMGESAFAQIIPLLHHEHARVRLAATNAIGYGSRMNRNSTEGRKLLEKAERLLEKQLTDESPNVRSAAANGLRSIGGASQAVDALLAAAADPGDDARVNVFSALADTGDPRAVDVFLAGLNDPHKVVRWRSAEGLGRFRATRAVEPLLAALRSDDSQLRHLAATSLGQIGHARALEPLVALNRTDEDLDVRAAAGRAIGQIEHPNVSPSDIAWGTPVDTVQLGLRCQSGIRPYRMGEIVRYERLIRNSGKREWTVEVASCGLISPHVKDGDVVLHSGFALGGRWSSRKVTVRPGETRQLDTTEFILRPVGWKPFDKRHTLYLLPGKYRVSTLWSQAFGGKPPENVLGKRLSTGQLDLTILPEAP